MFQLNPFPKILLGLVLIAVVMACFVSGSLMIGNDADWARSVGATLFLVSVIGALPLSILGVMLVLYAIAELLGVEAVVRHKQGQMRK